MGDRLWGLQKLVGQAVLCQDAQARLVVGAGVLNGPYALHQAGYAQSCPQSHQLLLGLCNRLGAVVRDHLDSTRPHGLPISQQHLPTTGQLTI